LEEIKKLIREVHRRSLWQVLGIFLAASWVVLQVVEVLTETAGLPDWTPSMALVLLLLGLPVCLATAFVQEGMPGQGVSGHTSRGMGEADGGGAESGAAADDVTAKHAGVVAGAAAAGASGPAVSDPATAYRFLTWRNAILGGIGAFALLGFSLIAYFVMWTTGIGPVGNLVAQGVIEEGDRVVLADFSDATGEGLGEVVTEALRVDLSEASVIALAAEADLVSTFELMRLEPGAPLPSELALDAATRAGVPAVIDGSVAPAGSGYVVTAALRASDGGRPLATFRVTAESPDEIIGSIDKLSQDIRERSGESLRDIRSGEPLERVTTNSLEALRLYSEAEARFGADEWSPVIELLREAVEIDPSFAMAWRKLAAAYGNVGSMASLQEEAATRAYEHRDRLTERERHLAEAYYFEQVENDAPRAIAAYQALLALEPDHSAGLNNLGNVFSSVGDLERAIELYRRAVDGPGRTPTAYYNLVRLEVALGRYEAAASTIADFEAAYPAGDGIEDGRFHVLMLNGAYGRAADLGQAILGDPGRPATDRSDAAFWLAKLAYRQGRWTEGRDLMDRAIRIAAQVRPAFESNRHFWATVLESALGDPGVAITRARELVVSEGFSETGVIMPLSAGWAAKAGDVALARSILAGEHGPIDADSPTTRRTEILVRAHAGDSDGIVAELEALREEAGCLGPYCWERRRAEAAALSGDAARAIPLYESVANRGGDLLVVAGFVDVEAQLALGPLYEAVGDTASAIDAYQRIVTLWAGGDPGAQQVVRRFQGRIEALGGG
jgi:tetratricopeptide (TPR) repeat protein